MSLFTKQPSDLESRGYRGHLIDVSDRCVIPALKRTQTAMSETIAAVSDASFQSDVIEASKSLPVMVDFWADWCRPCHMLTPTVEEIAREQAGKVKVGKLNVDENMNAAG